MNCGQYLDWSEAENMQTVYILAHDSEEAGYWSAQYESLHGTSYAVDVEKWRLISREYPILLYFAFPCGTGYGRFMRKAAKEATIIKDIQEEQFYGNEEHY